MKTRYEALVYSLCTSFVMNLSPTCKYSCQRLRFGNCEISSGIESPSVEKFTDAGDSSSEAA
jgi:hypothetical protein